MKFELGTHSANFDFDEERWSTSVCMWIKGTVNGAQVAKKSHKKALPVQILAHVDVDSAASVGIIFCDTWVNHKNNEN